MKHAKEYEAKATNGLIEPAVVYGMVQSLKRQRSVELKPCIIQFPYELTTEANVLSGVFPFSRIRLYIFYAVTLERLQGSHLNRSRYFRQNTILCVCHRT